MEFKDAIRVVGADVHMSMLVDSSGSMKMHKQVVVESINSCLDELKSKYLAGQEQCADDNKMQVKISTKLFSSPVTKELKLQNIFPVDYLPLLEVPKMKSNQYNPEGGTPMYDTIATCMLTEAKNLPNLHVMMFTDGEDDESQLYKYKESGWRNKTCNDERNNIYTLISTIKEERLQTFGPAAILVLECYWIGDDKNENSKKYVSKMEELGFTVKIVPSTVEGINKMMRIASNSMSVTQSAHVTQQRLSRESVLSRVV